MVPQFTESHSNRARVLSLFCLNSTNYPVLKLECILCLHFQFWGYINSARPDLFECGHRDYLECRVIGHFLINF